MYGNKRCIVLVLIGERSLWQRVAASGCCHALKHLGAMVGNKMIMNAPACALKSFYSLGEAKLRPQSNKNVKFRDAKFLPYYVSLHTLC